MQGHHGLCCSAFFVLVPAFDWYQMVLWWCDLFLSWKYLMQSGNTILIFLEQNVHKCYTSNATLQQPQFKEADYTKLTIIQIFVEDHAEFARLCLTNV